MGGIALAVLKLTLMTTH